MFSVRDTNYLHPRKNNDPKSHGIVSCKTLTSLYIT